ncbi:MAG: DUF6675 family protein [Geminicoccaceae bacterium]
MPDRTEAGDGSHLHRARRLPPPGHGGRPCRHPAAAPLRRRARPDLAHQRGHARGRGPACGGPARALGARRLRRAEPPSGATFVAVAGRFRHQGDARSLLARIGAISAQRDIVYWSVSHLGWRPLLVDASALAGPDPEQRRGDFTAAELHAGARLYTLYDDEDEPGPVVFATEIREAGPDGFVTTLVNQTAMRLMGFSIADPGYLSGMTAIHRVGDDLWDYYALNAIRLTPLAAAMLPDASLINRAVASYRYIAGIPGDRDPPAALK